MNKQSFMACAALFLASLTAHADQPVSQFGNFNGHGYELVPTPTTWHLAKKKAEKSDGYLVVISSGAENQFVLDLLKKATKSEGCNVWIGLSDEKCEGAWDWSNGEKLSYVKWANGEPNNYAYAFMGGSEHAVHMNGGGEWNDYASDGRSPYVIEFNHETTDDRGSDPSVASKLKLKTTR